MRIFVRIVKAHVVSILISQATILYEPVDAIHLQQIDSVSQETTSLAQVDAEKSCGFLCDLFGCCP